MGGKRDLYEKFQSMVNKFDENGKSIHYNPENDTFDKDGRTKKQIYHYFYTSVISMC